MTDTVRINECFARDGLQHEEAFVPTDTMPGPVQAFAEHQPVTSIVDTIRAIFAGQDPGNELWIALAWCFGLLAVAYVLATSAYRRKFA